MQDTDKGSGTRVPEQEYDSGLPTQA